MRPNALHADATKTSRTGFNHPAAWCICACFGVCWMLLHGLPWVPFDRTDQIALWLCAALWLALWSVPHFSKVAALLLVFLIISLWGITPHSPILAKAASDGLLIALSAFGLSVAARETGVLGWLVSYSYRRAIARQGLACSAALSLAFAFLPSPQNARTWMRIWQLLPEQMSGSYRHIGLTSQLCARLICIAAHPANILLMALLPQSGTDRFLPWHWALQTWPLAAVALCGSYWASKRTQLPTLAHPQTTANIWRNPLHRTQAHIFAAITASLCCGILLQPLHGLSTGLLAVLALVALFVLQAISAQQLHQGVDWSLLIILIVLPGLLVCFSSSIPTLGYAWDITHTPWLLLPMTLLLRTGLPSASVAALSLLFALTWSAQHGHDLLNLAIPLVVAVHISDFLVERAATASRFVARLRALLLDPVTWCCLAVFHLWCVWYGW